MKKLSLFIGSLICLSSFGCSNQEPVPFESLKEAYFNFAQLSEIKPLKFDELTEMLSDYSYDELVYDNQDIYTFTGDSEELTVSKPNDTNEARISGLVYTMYDESDSLSVSYPLSTEDLDELKSALVLNTSNLDTYKKISATCFDESSKLFDYYLRINEQLLENTQMTLTELTTALQLEPTLQEDVGDGIYYLVEDVTTGDLLSFKTPTDADTINQMTYANNATGSLHNTLQLNNSLLFNLTTELDTPTIQKEIITLFNK